MLSPQTTRRRRRAALAHLCPTCRQPWALQAVRLDTGGWVRACLFCGTPAVAAAAQRDHRVLFFDSDEALGERLDGFVAGTLDDEVCLLIRRPERRVPPLPTPGAAGARVVELDAATTLAAFVRDGRPVPELFDRTVGALVRDLLTDASGLRAYGELVDLLWEQGSPRGALELEQLWNRLQREASFVLLCGYRAGAVDASLPSGRGAISRFHIGLAA